MRHGLVMAVAPDCRQSILSPGYLDGRDCYTTEQHVTIGGVQTWYTNLVYKFGYLHTTKLLKHTGIEKWRFQLHYKSVDL